VVAFHLHARPNLASNWFDAGGRPEGNDAELCRRGQEPQPPGIHTTDEGADGGVGAEQAHTRTATVMKRWLFAFWTSANLSLDTRARNRLDPVYA
jgi:hypothetical protein